MGWFVGQTNDGEPVIWHSGDTPNFLSEMIILPDRNLGVVMLVNSQTSRDAHSVALGIASLFMGSELKLPASPWWASWAEIDHIALIALILALVLILGLIPYLWWQWRIIRRYRRREITPPNVGKTMKIWLFVFPATPWVFLALIAAAAYVAAQTMFGFNLFLTIIRFGSFAPPSVMIAAMTILASILLWMIALTVTGYLRATARVRDKLNLHDFLINYVIIDKAGNRNSKRKHRDKFHSLLSGKPLITEISPDYKISTLMVGLFHT